MQGWAGNTSVGEGLFQAPPEALHLAPKEVHVWPADLARLEGRFPAFGSTVGIEEEALGGRGRVDASPASGYNPAAGG